MLGTLPTCFFGPKFIVRFGHGLTIVGITVYASRAYSNSINYSSVIGFSGTVGKTAVSCILPTLADVVCGLPTPAMILIGISFAMAAAYSCSF